MSMNALERSIMRNIKVLAKNKKLGEKNLMEWSTSEEKVKRNVREGEVIYHDALNGVWVAIKP